MSKKVAKTKPKKPKAELPKFIDAETADALQANEEILAYAGDLATEILCASEGTGGIPSEKRVKNLTKYLAQDGVLEGLGASVNNVLTKNIQAVQSIINSLVSKSASDEIAKFLNSSDSAIHRAGTVKDHYMEGKLRNRIALKITIPQGYIITNDQDPSKNATYHDIWFLEPTGGDLMENDALSELVSELNSNPEHFTTFALNPNQALKYKEKIKRFCAESMLVYTENGVPFKMSMLYSASSDTMFFFLGVLCIIYARSNFSAMKEG